MMRLIQGMVLIFSLSGVVQAAERETLNVTWTEFQRQAVLRNLSDSVQVVLADSTEIKARILRIEGDGLVVSRGRATQPWDTTASEAKIPQAMIRKIRVNGRVGRRGLIGSLIGLGAGAALTTGTWAYYRGVDREAGFYNTAATALSIPAGALAGYLVGRFSSKRGPEFVIRTDASRE